MKEKLSRLIFLVYCMYLMNQLYAPGFEECITGFGDNQFE